MFEIEDGSKQIRQITIICDAERSIRVLFAEEKGKGELKRDNEENLIFWEKKGAKRFAKFLMGIFFMNWKKSGESEIEQKEIHANNLILVLNEQKVCMA